jgi:hypothetical protein
VLRALRHLCLNDARGDGFVTWGFDSYEIELTADGRVVSRSKAKGVNRYALDGKEFAAFGSSVPEEVAALLRVSPLNFQGQLDAPFWFCETPGKVSKELNAVVDLESMDRVISSVGSTDRKARWRVEHAEGRLRDAEGAEARSRKIDGFLAALARCEALDSDIAQKRATIASVTRGARDARLLASKGADAARFVTGADAALALGGKVESKREKLTALRQLVSQAKTCARPDPPDLSRCESLGARRLALLDRVGSLRSLADELRRTEATACRHERSYTATRSEIESLTSDECPVCLRTR